MTDQALIAQAKKEGFAATAVIDTEQIVFDPSFRTYCEENLCGQYGCNYSCPPDCGSPQAMKQRILRHRKALVLETMWEISDYSDKPRIQSGKAFHNQAQRRLMEYAGNQNVSGFMVGASGCSLCSPCARKTGEPCRFPSEQYSCMSAYCIYVKKLADLCGMEYHCRPGFLSFFGMLIYD